MFSFEKGSIRQNHSPLGSHYPAKKSPQGEFTPTPYHYLENPGCDRTFSYYRHPKKISVLPCDSTWRKDKSNTSVYSWVWLIIPFSYPNLVKLSRGVFWLAKGWSEIEDS